MKKKTSKEKIIMIKFIKDIYVIDNFKINLLIKMYILDSKEVIIDFL